MDIVAFIDESGDVNLDTSIDNVTKFFVVACVVINADSGNHVNEVVLETRKKYFSGSELKSHGIARGLKRRLNVLSALSKINYTTHIVAIDKSMVWNNSGLIYKQSFLKFTNGLLYRKIFRSYSYVEAFCDKNGGKDFQESFSNYLIDNHRQDLFKNSIVIPVDSKDVNGVQIADIIAGSVRELLEYEKSDELYQLIKDKTSMIEIWPPNRDYLVKKSAFSAQEDFDQYVEDYCTSQATAFLDRNITSEDPDVVLKVRAVEYLLAHYYSSNDDSYVYTKEIMEALLKEHGEMSEYYFRSKILGELRDNEVIIAGSSKGLKIPTSVSDLKRYVEDNAKKIMPMVDRLGRARGQISTATLGKLDILDEHPEIKSMMNFIEKNKFMSNSKVASPF